jgi:hypothetical protein
MFMNLGEVCVSCTLTFRGDGSGGVPTYCVVIGVGEWRLAGLRGQAGARAERGDLCESKPAVVGAGGYCRRSDLGDRRRSMPLHDSVNVGVVRFLFEVAGEADRGMETVLPVEVDENVSSGGVAGGNVAFRRFESGWARSVRIDRGVPFPENGFGRDGRAIGLTGPSVGEDKITSDPENRRVSTVRVRIFVDSLRRMLPKVSRRSLS